MSEPGPAQDDSAARRVLELAIQTSPISVGLIVGLAVTQQVKLTAAAVGGLIVALIGVTWPVTLVAGMWLGMLFDRLGITGMNMGGFPITASKLSVLGSIGLWILHAVLTRSPLFRWHPVFTAMLGFIVATGVTTAWSNCMTVGKFDIFGLAMMTVMMSLVYSALAEAELKPLFRFLGGMFLIALLASIRHGGGSTEYGRSAGTMGDPNEWATMVILLTPLFLGGLASDEEWTGRPIRMGLVMLAPLAVLVSASRAALVMGALISPGCLWLFRHRKGEIMACMGTAVLAAPFAVDLNTAWSRLVSLVQTFNGHAVVQDDSLEERSELARQGKQLFLDHWFLGAGPGNFSHATGFISTEGFFRPAHDTYLEVASEQGIVGLIPFFIFLGSIGWALRRGFGSATTEDDRNRIAGAALGLTALGLMAATLGLLTFSMAYLVVGFSLAILHQARLNANG